MRKLTIEEYFSEFGDWEDTKDIAYFYVSDNEECPYIGVEYTDGDVWVYGLKIEYQIVDGDELEFYLSQS